MSNIWIIITAIATSIVAIATVIYMFITRAILLNSNRQYKITAYINLLTEIKQHYENINNWKEGTPWKNGCELKGYTSLHHIMPDNIGIEKLSLAIKEPAIKDLGYVASELLFLCKGIENLHRDDKKFIRGQIIDFYDKKINDFINIITNHEKDIPELKNNDEVKTFYKLKDEITKLKTL